MFKIGNFINDQRRESEFCPILYGFVPAKNKCLTLEEFKDFANVNDIKIIEIKTKDNNPLYIKVEQHGITFILFADEQVKFNLLKFKPLLDLNVLCSLDNKESYLDWIYSIWNPNTTPAFEKEKSEYLLCCSDIKISQFLDKVYIFEQKEKEYYVIVNRKFNEYKIEESFDLLNIQEKDI